MADTIQRILILGGTGFVGRALCERLVERNGGGGGLLRVPTRRLAHGDAVRTLPTVELVQADVHDPQALQALVAGMDAVVNLVAILHGSAAAFEQVHVALPRTLAAACAAQRVRRLVHVGALGVGPGDAPDPAALPSAYLRSKAAGETVLRSAALDLTVLRPSVIFGAQDRFLNTFAALAALAPVLPLPGANEARFQPVWVEDVAQAIACCLDRPDTIGRTYELAGPGTFTLGELAGSAAEWAGRRRPVLALPLAVGTVQAALMELLPGQPLMSRDNVASMRVPNVATGTLPGLAELGIEPTALEAVAPGYLGPRHGRARLEPLRARARRQ
jgi:NADH dehydrogenase